MAQFIQKASVSNQETAPNEDSKLDLIEAHFTGASFGYGKKAVTVKERLVDFEDWYNKKFKIKGIK